MTTKVRSNPLVRLDNSTGIVALLQARETWHTAKSSGGMSGRVKDVAGTYIAHAEREVCGHCGQEKLYIVYSYKTIMYSECQNCKHTFTDASYYSEQTRRLQDLLAKAYPAYRGALDAQKSIEDQARITWARDRRKGLAQVNRVTGYNGLGQPCYATSANLHDMLEHHLGKELPGHFIHEAE